MSGPETRIVAQIKTALKRRGAFYFKVHGSEFMMAGLPDLIVCYRGLFIGMEVKTAEGVVSDVQAYVHRRIRLRRADGIAVVVHSPAEAMRVLDVIDGHHTAFQPGTDAMRAHLSDIFGWGPHSTTKATPKGGDVDNAAGVD